LFPAVFRKTVKTVKNGEKPTNKRLETARKPLAPSTPSRRNDPTFDDVFSPSPRCLRGLG
jgi:hypothetical protein